MNKKRFLLIFVLIFLVSVVYSEELQPGKLWINGVEIPFEEKIYAPYGVEEKIYDRELIIETSKDIYDIGEDIKLTSQSKITNNEDFDLKGYLSIKIEKNLGEDFWGVYKIVVSEIPRPRSKPRIVSAKDTLKLDTFFNNRNIKINEVGKYRVSVEFRDENNKLIKELKANYEFNVGIEPEPEEVYTSLTIATSKDRYYAWDEIELTDPQEFINVPNIPLKKEKQLEFGNIKSLNELGLSEIDKYTIIENTGGLSYNNLGVNEEIINFNINIDNIKLSSGEEYDKIIVDDLPTGTKQGEPALPVKTFRVEIPKNSNIESVNIKSGNYVDILTELNIIPVPQAATWAFGDINVVPNSNIYNMEDFFPKTVLYYDYGEDNDKAYANIKFYPMQYIPKLKKSILIKDVVISIQYSLAPLAKPSLSYGDIESTNAESIIITHPDFKEAADKLAQFHIDDEEIDTSVYETTWINDNYQAAEDPEYDGCKDSDFCQDYIDKGYDYELAKKIIAFLRDNTAHPNLKYVTIIGEAVHMPPSYYATAPTDFFYASPDYDLVPNYGVGRISVNTLDEANIVVDKTINWYKNEDKTWFNKAAVFGGNAFTTYQLYIGEFIIAGAIDRNYFDGMEIEKNFDSNNRLERQELLNSLSGGYGLVYHIDHGSGSCTTGRVCTEDLMNLNINNNLPIFVSIACSNGKYDSNIVGNGQKSFSEAVLLSPAGGIAYIGGDRTNYGGIPAELDQGRLDMTIEHPYMQEMLNLVFESYKNGAEKLGDLYSYAAEQYAVKKTISTTGGRDQLTLFAFTLQGDAALKIPKNEYEDSYDYPESTAIEPDEYRDFGGMSGDAPYYGLGQDESFSTETPTESENIKIRLKEMEQTKTQWGYRYSGNVIDEQTISVNGKAIYSYTPDFNSGERYYQKVAESDNKKEGWFYIQVERLIEGIDLEASYIDWDWPAISGEKNNIELNVKNLGNRDAENVEISLYYKSTNGVDDYKIIDTVYVSKIYASSRVELSIPWIPEKGGGYMLKLKVTAENDVNPDNNEFENHITIISNVPDVSVYIKSKDKVIQDEDNWIEVVIENEGIKEAENVKVSLFDITDDEILIYEKDGISISRESEAESFFPWTPTETGYRTLKAVVECAKDENLDNNEYERSFQVIANKPDVRAYLERIEKIKVNEEAIIKGTVTNVGIKKSTNVVAKLYKKRWVDGEDISFLIESKNVKDLDEDEDGEIEFKWTPTDIGWINLVMVVSADGDENQDNDEYSTSFRVMPEKPELRVYIQHNEDNLVVDKNNEIKVEIYNNGFADAQDAKLTLEIYEEKKNIATLLKKEEKTIDVGSNENKEMIFNYIPKEKNNLIFKAIIYHPDDYNPNNNNNWKNKNVVTRSMMQNSEGILEGYLLMKIQKYLGEPGGSGGGSGEIKPETGFSSSYGKKQLVRVFADRDKQEELLKMDLDIASFKKDEYIDVIMKESQLSEIKIMDYSTQIIPVNEENLFDSIKYEEAYHTYDSMISELQQIEQDNSNIAKLYDIGDSIEGRDIWAMKISDNVAEQEDEPEVLIDGNHHAREIMTVEIPIHLINYLVDNYNNDEIKEIVDNNQIWVIPMVNPDGHVYVETEDIWWRKNRRDNGDGSFGVDLNRNYGYKWGYDDEGSSPYPGYETYRGVNAFSEPETQAIKNLIEVHDFVWDISYHSYGKMFLYPFSYDYVVTEDNGFYKDTGNHLKRNYLHDFVYGTPPEIIYAANGATFDWMYGEGTDKYAMHGFAFEVNDASEGGFRPDPSLIKPTCGKHIPLLLKFIRSAKDFPEPSELPKPGWRDYKIVVDDLDDNNKREIAEYETLALDQIWNNEYSNEKKEYGNYRVYASFLDANGNVIIKDNNELNAIYEFEVR